MEKGFFLAILWMAILKSSHIAGQVLYHLNCAARIFAVITSEIGPHFMPSGLGHGPPICAFQLR
jgi:hypothetical protein